MPLLIQQFNQQSPINTQQSHRTALDWTSVAVIPYSGGVGTFSSPSMV